jgi:hypothetical protein
MLPWYNLYHDLWFVPHNVHFGIAMPIHRRIQPLQVVRIDNLGHNSPHLNPGQTRY